MSGHSDEDVYLKVQGFTFLERNPVTGTETFFRTEPDGSTTIYARQDVTELLDVNKALFHEHSHEPMKDWVPLARFDDVSMQKMNIGRAIAEGDRKHVKKILNDSEYSKFRTSNLKVKLMATFADYLDLRLAVSEFVDRRDITDVMPRFVQAAENALNGFLRAREMVTTGATLTFTNGYAALPADFLEVETLWDATNRYPLSGVNNKQLIQGTSDIYSFAISGTNCFIDALTGTRLLDYYAALPTLTASSTTSNWLLQSAPNLYLYAVSLEAAKWLKNADLVAAAQKLFDQEMLEQNRTNARARYGNVSIRMRSPTP